MDRIITGDCVAELAKIPHHSVDLVFADPPFNIGYQYDSYQDFLTKKDYLEWTHRWLGACNRVMKPAASIYVAIGLQYQAEMKVAMDTVGFHWRDTLCWHYTFGPAQKDKWTPSWVAIHYYCRDRSDRAWNGEAVRVPSARQLKYNDRRANSKGKVPDNAWVLLPNEYDGCFVPGQNAMLESRVCGTFKDRTAHPCQMPEAVMSRIIAASSKPGDLVLDPFSGSGGTAVAAKRLGRRYLGVELSEEYAAASRLRLEKVEVSS